MSILKKIIILAPANNIHTLNWINAIDNSISVYLFTLHKSSFIYNSNTKIINLPYFFGLGYLINIPYTYIFSYFIKPNIVHAHYATGYGLLGIFTCVDYRIVSVWGSDVLVFPEISSLHKKFLLFVLLRYNKICSTSNYMIKKLSELAIDASVVFYTPFPVDTDVFVSSLINKDNNEFVVGTVKKIEYVYGIDVMIRVFAFFISQLSNICPERINKVKFIIVGSGSLLEKYRLLVSELNLDLHVDFVGDAIHEEVPIYLNQMDVFLSLSRVESFGVSVIEASATELPVIASDIGGLTEVVVNNYTGYLVKPTDIEKAASLLLKLFFDLKLRKKFGLNGRNHVIDNFSMNSFRGIVHSSYSKIF